MQTENPENEITNSLDDSFFSPRLLILLKKNKTEASLTLTSWNVVRTKIKDLTAEYDIVGDDGNVYSRSDINSIEAEILPMKRQDML